MIRLSSAVEAADHPGAFARLLVGELHLHQVRLHIRRRFHRRPSEFASHTSCYGMQCSIPLPVLTQVAELAPQASLQKSVSAEPDAARGAGAGGRRGPGVDVDRRHAGVGAVALADPAVGVLADASVPVQLAAPQQKTRHLRRGARLVLAGAGRAGSRTRSQHAAAARRRLQIGRRQSGRRRRAHAEVARVHADVVEAGGATPSVHPAITRISNAAARPIIPL